MLSSDSDGGPDDSGYQLDNNYQSDPERASLLNAPLPGPASSIRFSVCGGGGAQKSVRRRPGVVRKRRLAWVRRRRRQQQLAAEERVRGGVGVQRTVFAFCVAEKFGESERSVREALGAVVELPYGVEMLNEDVAHCRVASNGGDVFVFLSLGSVVAWDVGERERRLILRKLRRCGEPLDVQEEDDFEYTYSEDMNSDFNVVDSRVLVFPNEANHVRMRSAEEDRVEGFGDNNYVAEAEQQNIKRKLACSYALATSVKLGAVEEQIDRVIDETENIPWELATKGRVFSLNKHEVSCKIGELFMHKASINLLHEILDTPDYFWDFPILEEIYKKCREAMDMDKRVEVLNQRMEVLSELLALLQSEKNDQHSKTLEWIIILLIVIEVIIASVDIFVQLSSKR